jgi:hypothetical protein
LLDRVDRRRDIEVNGSAGFEKRQSAVAHRERQICGNPTSISSISGGDHLPM